MIALERKGLERDDAPLNRYLAPYFRLGMIFSENRFTHFRIMLPER